MKRLDVRARVLRELRSFFEARGFLEVETPTLVPSPGMDVHLAAFESDGPANLRYLITSPEYQMKRLLASGYSQIFQVARAFRKDESGGRHNPEFTLVEWYRANAGWEEVLADTEQLIAKVTGGVVHLGATAWGPARSVRCLPPFRRIPVLTAFATWGGVTAEEALHLAETDEDRFYFLLVDRVEPAIAALDEAIVLCDYPATQASLARKKPEDPRLAERFEIYVAGVELCNGFGELVDPVEQRNRFEIDQRARAARGLPVYPIDENFLKDLEKMPPAGGNALGVDRLAALVAGTTSIDAVLAFPATEL